MACANTAIFYIRWCAFVLSALLVVILLQQFGY